MKPVGLRPDARELLEEWRRFGPPFSVRFDYVFGEKKPIGRIVDNRAAVILARETALFPGLSPNEVELRRRVFARLDENLLEEETERARAR